jgi:cytochrome bd-type quinol oxidase subunit 2
MFGDDYSLWYSWQHYRKRLTPKNDQVSMRWKLLVLVSFVAALIACGVWSLLIMIIFGHAVRPIQPHDWILLASAAVPLAMAGFAGFFIYRHTARRRKTQAVLTVFLTLLLSIAACLAAIRLFPNAITIYVGQHRRVRN